MTPVSRPMVTVVVPTRNRPELLARALASIAAQTWRELQVIVVNDAGCDVAEVVKPFLTRPEDQYLRHDANRGLSAARNTALAAAAGKYVAYLDDDDRWLPHHVETLVTALERAGAAIGYANAIRVRHTRVNGEYTESGRTVADEPWDRTRMVLANYLNPVAFMHTLACVRECGGFDERLTRSEDMDLWIRISARHEVLHVPVATCEYRMVDDGSNMTSASAEPFLRARALIFSKYPDEVTRAVDEMIDRWLRNEREVKRCHAALHSGVSGFLRRVENWVRDRVGPGGPR
ncbi:MAG: glycosyltransferase family 2 protein [Kiritimatiellia bacterium]